MEDYQFDSKGPDDRFRDEQIIKGALLAETDLKETFPYLAQRLLISKSAKDLITLLSHSMFDKTKVLGRLNYKENLTVYIAVIKMRINVNTAMAGIKPSDRRNQGFVDIISQMLNHYEIYMTRSVEVYEREKQNEYTVNSNVKQDITQRGAPPMGAEEPKGLAGLFKDV